MSYVRAEEVLPKELIRTIQQYVNGQTIYIPGLEKQAWGSHTDTRRFLRERNQEIYRDYTSGVSVTKLAVRYSLSDKSIQRIIRIMKAQEISEFSN